MAKIFHLLALGLVLGLSQADPAVFPKFSTNVNQVQRGQTFKATCDISVLPEKDSYNVTFHKVNLQDQNEVVLAEFILTDQTSADLPWSTTRFRGNQNYSIEYENAVHKYPTFSIEITPPEEINSQENFWCDVSYPDKPTSIKSNVWISNL